MDAFKPDEIARMDKGGNRAWRAFFDAYAHEHKEGRALRWHECSVAERYAGAAGEEWKARLTAAVEGREYVPPPSPPPPPPPPPAAENKTGRNRSGGGGGGSGGGTEAVDDGRLSGQKEQQHSDAAAARNNNSSGSSGSRGAKYTGFGNDDDPSSRLATQQSADGSAAALLPSVGDFQKDPLAALSKGFGWFSTAVGKGAKSVNSGLIQPAAKMV